MNAFSEALAPWLTDNFLLSSLLLIVVLIAVWRIGQPAQRLAVARPTLAALVLLTGLCALPGWSLIHLLTEDATITDKQEVLTLPPAPLIEQPALPLISTPLVEAQPSPTVAPPALSAPAAKPFTWTTWLVGVYLCGCLLTIVWQASGGVLARRLVRDARPAPPQLQTLLKNLGEDDKPLPKLLVSARIQSPAAIGVLQPTVLLPQTMLESEQDSLRPILAHELAHVRHGDLRTLAAVRVLTILLWPQPLYWLLRRQIRRDQETLADATAAEATSRVDFAEQLVAWARVAMVPGTFRLASSVGLWESPSQLKQRIAILLDERFQVLHSCSRRWRVGTLAALASLALGLSFVSIWPAQILVATERNIEQDNDKDSRKYSFGGKVEVVAIGSYGEEPQRWWDESGQPIDTVPFTWGNVNSNSVSSGGAISSPGDIIRRVVIRFDDLPADARVSWSRIQEATATSGGSITVNGQNNASSYRAQAISMASNLKTLNLRIGVSTGPWKTMHKLTGSGYHGGPKGKSVTFFNAPNTSGHTHVAVSHNYSDQDYRVFAVDKQGREHVQAGWGGNSSNGIVTAHARFPNLAPEEIDHFEFKVRDYEWVEIENLPTEPRERREQPWSVHGRVIDADGNPLADVELHAATGNGSLMRGGNTITDSEGRYRLHFGPGMRFMNSDYPLGVGVQAASIYASKPGWFEANLCRQGNLLMSDLTLETITDGAERWGHKSIDTVVFAKEPKEVNFTMKPAAVLEGVFEESSRGWSVDDQQFYVVGKELPPSSNVLQSVTTNDDGEFRIDRLPTGFEWRLGMRIAHTALEIETDPFHFDQPGIYRCRLVLSSDASTDGEARLKLQLKDVERQE